LVTFELHKKDFSEKVETVGHRLDGSEENYQWLDNNTYVKHNQFDRQQNERIRDKTICF